MAKKTSTINKKKINAIIRKECKQLDKKIIAMITNGNLYRAKIAFHISYGAVPTELLAAIEMTHSASLLHDDVLDNEKWRRGGVSINNLIGNKFSILNGDILLSSATALVARLGEQELLNSFLEAIKKTCQGEMEQQSFKIEKVPSTKKYFLTAEAKTGSFFGFAAYSGAYFSPLKKERHALQTIFSKIGALYQLMDDLKDSKLSKKITTDIQNNAINFPIVISQKNIQPENFKKLPVKEKIAHLQKHATFEKGKNYIRTQYDQLTAQLHKKLQNKKILEAIDGIFQ